MAAFRILPRIGAACSRITIQQRGVAGCGRWSGGDCLSGRRARRTGKEVEINPFLRGALAPRRRISSTSKAFHGDHGEEFKDAPSVDIVWENSRGDVKKTQAKCGMNLMRVAHAHGIELEGACEGVCACSTCHVILSGEVFDRLPEATEDEEDMLDMAFGLTETSRLGCQVIVTDEMDGIVVKLPPATRNFYVDGHVPQPH